MEEPEEILSFQIEEEDLLFKRLDQFLAEKIPKLSRSLIKKLHIQELITSDTHSKLELKKMPPVGTIISVTLPHPKPLEAEAQDIPLDILFEDEHLIIINKAAGMVVHPAPGNPDKTLVNAILFHCPDLKGIGNVARPGIVHRLDKGTTGIMVVAKEQKCHEELVKLFSKHDIQRKYEALVLGNKVSPEGTVESLIGRSPNDRLKMKANVKNGKNAITHYKVIDYFKNSSHMELTLETGRTHQIRVHLAQILNRPILNDSTYGHRHDEKKRISSQILSSLSDYEYPFLHAKVLGFTHPITKKELYFEQEAPDIFNDTLKLLRDE